MSVFRLALLGFLLIGRDFLITQQVLSFDAPIFQYALINITHPIYKFMNF